MQKILIILFLFFSISSLYSEDSSQKFISFETQEDKSINKSLEQFKKSINLHGSFGFKSYILNNSQDKESSIHLLRSEVLLNAEYKVSKQLFLFFGVKSFYENREDTNSPNEDLSVLLNEAFISYRTSKVNIKFGKQIIKWGKADEKNPVDILNPQDYSDLFLFDKEDRKIGNYIFEIDYSMFSFVTLKIFWFPVFKSHTSPLSPWYDSNRKNLLDNIANNSDFSYISENPVAYPGKKINDTEIAAEISFSFPFLDLSFYYFNGYNKYPNTVYYENSGKYYALFKYKRIQMFGIDFSSSKQIITIRGEAAFYPKQYFEYKSDAALIKSAQLFDKNYLNFILGLDLDISSFYGNIQFYHARIFEHENSMAESKTDTEIISKMEYKINQNKENETLLGLNLIYSFDDSLLIKPYVKYKPIDNFSLKLLAYVFLGDKNSSYGTFKDNQVVAIEIDVFF